MNLHVPFRRVSVALACLLGLPVARAATWDWNSTTAAWSDPSAWTPNTVPLSSIDTVLRFGGVNPLAFVSTNDLPSVFFLHALELNSSSSSVQSIATSAGSVLSFSNDGIADPLFTQKGSGAFNLDLGIEAINALTLGGAGTGLVTFNGIVTGGGGLTFGGGNWRLTNVGNNFTGGINVNTGASVELAQAGAAPQGISIAVGASSILGGNAGANVVTINGGTLKLTTTGNGSMALGGARPITFGANGGVLDLRNVNTTSATVQGGQIASGDLTLTVNSAAATPAVVRFSGGQLGLGSNNATNGNWDLAANVLRLSGQTGTGTLRIELTNGAMLRAGNGAGTPQNNALTTIWRGVVGGDPTSGPLGTSNTGLSLTTGRVGMDVNEITYTSLTLEGALQVGLVGASRALSGTIVVAGTAGGAPGYVAFTGRATGTQLSNVVQNPGANTGTASQHPLWLLRNNVGSITIQDGGTVVLDPRLRTDTSGTNGNGVAMDGQLTIQGGGSLVISQSATNFTPGIAGTTASVGDIIVYGDITATGSTAREAIFSIALPEPQAGATVISAVPAALTATATVASERPYGGLRFDDTRGTANFIVNGTGFGGLRINGVARPSAQLSSTGAVGGAPMADPVGADTKVGSVLTAARLSRLAGSGGYLTIAPEERTFFFPAGGEWANAVPVGLKVVNHRAAGADVSLASLTSFRHNIVVDTAANLQLGDAAPFTLDNNMTLQGKGSVTSNGSVMLNAGSSIAPGLNDIGALALTTGTLTISGNLRMDLAPTSADLLAVTGNLSLGGTLALTGTYGTTDLTLATYSGLLTGTFSNITGLSPLFSIDYGAGANGVIKLVYSTSPTRVWDGLPGAAWSVGGGNWKNSEVFADGIRARFDGTASGSTTVTISGSDVKPLETLVHTDTKNYTITSSAGAALAGIGPLTKTGAMILNLIGPASYAGGTQINEGTIAMGSDNALPDVGLVLIAAGATLNTQGHTDTVGDLSVAGSVSGSGTFTVNALTISGGGTFTPNLVSNGSITKTGGPGTFSTPIDFNGGVRGINVALDSPFTITSSLVNGGFDKTGLGDLILAPVSPNLHLGGTGVSGGKLIAQLGAIPANSPLTVNTGGTLEIMGAQPLTLSSLSGTGGTINGANGITLNQAVTTTFGGNITGVTSVNMNGTGQITLSGASTNSGGLFVNSGRVLVTSAGGGGAGIITVNPGALLGSGAGLTSRVDLLGGTFMGVGSPAVSVAANDVVTGPGTATTIALSDPLNPGTRSEMRVTGTLKGSGDLNVVISTNTPHPDGGVGFRLLGTGASDYSGTITMAKGTKFEAQTGQAGPFSPAGTAKLVFVAGNFTGGLNGDYSQFNVRNNFAGNTVMGNNVEIVGTGFVNFNMAGGAGAGIITTLGNLRIGGQMLGVNKNGTVTQVLEFPSVTLTGGDPTFSPTTVGFGASGTGDLRLGAISELIPGTGIVLDGANVLTLTSPNAYSGVTRVQNGTLRLGAAGALPASGSLVVNGGTVDLNSLTGGADQTTSGLSGTGGTITNTEFFTSHVLEAAQTSDTSFAGAFTGNLQLKKTGTGLLTLTGPMSATGGLSVEGGVVRMNGSVTAVPSVVSGGGTLGGTGAHAVVDARAGGVLSPGDFNQIALHFGGVLTATDVNFLPGAAMDISLAKTTPGAQPVSSDYTQLKITGSVTLTDPDLDMSLGSGIQNGDIFSIIINDGPGPIAGTFFGRQNGDIFTRGGQVWQISYFDDASTPGVFELAGGNDVALLAVPEPGSVVFLLCGAAIVPIARRRRRD